METEPAGGAAHLTRALARDLDGSFERLVLAHQDRLYTIALRMLGDSRDAEEVTQDALVRAYRALGSYDAQRILDLQLRPWLTTIVLTQPLDGDDERPGPATRLISSDRTGSPHDAVIHRESARRWASLVGGLPSHYRTAIVLRHVDGLSYAEMSIALGRPEGTLKAQVHRGLALLRAALERADTTERREMTA